MPPSLPPLFSLHSHRYLAKCVKCYDADSIHVAFFFHGTLTRFRCRLLGIDTPEIRTKDPAERAHARVARDFLREAILDKHIVIKCGHFDKYGRLLVWVHAYDPEQSWDGVMGMEMVGGDEGGNTGEMAEGEKSGGGGESDDNKSITTVTRGYAGSWNERLVQEGYAYQYNGGTRKAFAEWFGSGGHTHTAA